MKVCAQNVKITAKCVRMFLKSFPSENVMEVSFGMYHESYHHSRLGIDVSPILALVTPVIQDVFNADQDLEM